MQIFRPRKSEGAGNAGCPKHPQPVCIGSKHTVVTTGTPESSGIPCAMVLTTYTVLSPATNSSCHRRQRISGLSKTRLGSKNLRQLDTSNGCQDHTVLPYASAPFVRAPVDRSRVFRPALRCSRATTLPRPPHPSPTYVTIAIRPSFGPGRRGCRFDLG